MIQIAFSRLKPDVVWWVVSGHHDVFDFLEEKEDCHQGFNFINEIVQDAEVQLRQRIELGAKAAASAKVD
jgi:hypothetical protein